MSAGLTGLGAATAFSAGVPGQYVVISSPFGPPAFEVIVRAEGAPLAVGGFDQVMIAASPREGFEADLRAAGALFVFPAPVFPGCGDLTEAGA